MKPLLRIPWLIAAMASAVLAADTAPQPWPLPPADYFIERIPAPPQTGSTGDKADLDYTMAVQAAPTDAQIAHAIQSAGFNVFTFSEVLGPKFTPANFPKSAAFFKKLEVTINVAKNALKDHYARVRPLNAHSDVVHLIGPNESGYSYPSGHSTRSWTYALVLGNLDPSDRPAFLRSSAQVGWDRILSGLHYQSDVVNSRVCAELIYESLRKDPDFVKALDDLRAAEWMPSPAK